ncbi:E3 ubiquitin-protein ligase RHA2B-like isoform X1 [Cucurbita maxima]|uniref:E3 ubiquitin-protein ligase RHA2B-like isoform X1 n=1 Tax=Cucurbita maxima TaxID=3661 RepID=A0A6J1KMW2_CUCMA|nr:E3 ubiquitin-protein ligase RHA2B-like isoform X1 [Cucurbita maxima]
MGALSEFFSHLHTMTAFFTTLLILELVILVRTIFGLRPNGDKRVIPTAQFLKLIEEKNPTIRFSNKITSSPADQCAVCLSEFEEGEKVRKLQCNHTFHKDCLDNWLKLCFATCPLCRRKVLPDDIVAGYHRLRDRVEYDGSDEELIFLLSALHGNSIYRFF